MTTYLVTVTRATVYGIEADRVADAIDAVLDGEGKELDGTTLNATAVADEDTPFVKTAEGWRIKEGLMTEEKLKRRQGFAALSREQRTAIASQGGRKAQQLGTAHRWSPEEAAVAGRKGGLASKRARDARS